MERFGKTIALIYSKLQHIYGHSKGNPSPNHSLTDRHTSGVGRPTAPSVERAAVQGITNYPAHQLQHEQTVTGVGFWLPCGRANFVDPEEYQKYSQEPQPREQIAWETLPPNDLECSVFHRLYYVLQQESRGYIERGRLIPLDREGRRGISYPDASIFVRPGTPDTKLTLDCNVPGGEEDQAPEISLDPHGPIDQWQEGVLIKGLVLLVSADGFYLWLALHNVQITAEKVSAALKIHISSLVGQHFFSHYSGNLDDRSYASEAEKWGSLLHYQFDHFGILNFFQLNTILEGLYNATFDPDIFFQERALEDKRVEEAKKAYTLGCFIQGISVEFDLASSTNSRFEEIEAEAVSLVQDLLAPSSQPDIMQLRRLRELLGDCAVKQDVLRGFLLFTMRNSLKKVKWRVERTRRALLSKMLEITHRRQPLVQAETPGNNAELIRNENEDQLRGYVMLISAKLPILNNVRRYLDEVLGDIPQSSLTSNTKNLARSWISLLEAIRDNLHELERAIEQARLDRLVYEEEQIRAEQETLAELGRVRGRYGAGGGRSGGGSGADSSFNVASYIGTMLGVWATTITGALSVALTLNSNLPKDQQQPAGALIWQLLQILLPVALVSIGGVPLMARVSSWLWGWIVQRFRRQPEPVHNEKYYEFDCHLDIGIDALDAADLSEGRFALAQERRLHEQHEIALSGNDGLTQLTLTTREQASFPPDRMHFVRPPTRNSYRVDRTDDAEATYKVHVEADVRWRLHGYLRELSLWDRFSRLPLLRWLVTQWRFETLTLYLIYEILFHRPSETHRYVLRDVRAISLHSRILTKEELIQLKRLIITDCINVWIRDDQRRLNTNPSEVALDPLLTLHFVESHIDLRRFHPDTIVRKRIRSILFSQEMSQKDDLFVWLNIGAFVEHSDHRTLLEAFISVAWKDPEVHLLLIGDGPLLAQAKEQIRQAGLDHRVQFLGWCNDNRWREANIRIHNFLQAVDGYVAAESWMGAPIELFEAAASGVPFVAAKLPPLPTLKTFATKAGLTVRPGRPRQLAKAMKKLRTNNEMRKVMASNGIAWVNEREEKLGMHT